MFMSLIFLGVVVVCCCCCFFCLFVSLTPLSNHNVTKIINAFNSIGKKKNHSTN